MCLWRREDGECPGGQERVAEGGVEVGVIVVIVVIKLIMLGVGVVMVVVFVCNSVLLAISKLLSIAYVVQHKE